MTKRKSQTNSKSKRSTMTKRKRSKKELAAIRRYYAEQRKSKPQKRVEAPYPHFRYYKKSKHPALVVGEQVSGDNTEEYKYRKVTHSERDGRHVNEKITPNPNPQDPDPMYITKRVRHDDKENFELRPLPWKPPKK